MLENSKFGDNICFRMLVLGKISVLVRGASQGVNFRPRTLRLLRQFTHQSYPLTVIYKPKKFSNNALFFVSTLFS